MRTKYRQLLITLVLIFLILFFFAPYPSAIDRPFMSESEAFVRRGFSYITMLLVPAIILVFILERRAR